jgi:hypothetical protein
MVMGFVVDFWTLIFWRGGVVFLQGVLRKKHVLRVVFLWFFCGGCVVKRGELMDEFMVTKNTPRF